MAYTDAADPRLREDMGAPAAPAPRSRPGAGPQSPPPRGEPGTRVSQQQANYRMGNPLVNCGLCQNFTGSAGSNPYQCSKVAGEISPYGLSAQYARQDNPFLPGTQSTFDAGSEEPTEGPEPEQPEQPRLRIGNRSY